MGCWETEKIVHFVRPLMLDLLYQAALNGLLNIFFEVKNTVQCASLEHFILVALVESIPLSSCP